MLGPNRDSRQLTITSPRSETAARTTSARQSASSAIVTGALHAPPPGSRTLTTTPPPSRGAPAITPAPLARETTEPHSKRFASSIRGPTVSPSRVACAKRTPSVAGSASSPGRPVACTQSSYPRTVSGSTWPTAAVAPTGATNRTLTASSIARSIAAMFHGSRGPRATTSVGRGGFTPRVHVKRFASTRAAHRPRAAGVRGRRAAGRAAVPARAGRRRVLGADGRPG